MGKQFDGVDDVWNSRSQVDLGSRFLEFSQYTIGMVSKMLNGRFVAGFFNRCRVFEPTIYLSQVRRHPQNLHRRFA
jgi:hypothetical protein